MISECDAEDWSNDAENSALPSEITYTLKYIKIKLFQIELISLFFYLKKMQQYCRETAGNTCMDLAENRKVTF